jgi:SOS-response transcriptional repressor LexA
MTDDAMELFRLGVSYLKAKYRVKIREMADAAGVTTRHIQGFLSDRERKRLGREAQQKLADFLGHSIKEILAMADHSENAAPAWLQPLPFSSRLVEPLPFTVDSAELTIAPQPRNALRRIPVISWVRAGGFVDPQAQTTPGHADEWVETSATSCPNAFALLVAGDSMEPEFRAGDIITVDPDRTPVNGSYVIAKDGSEATFKQLIYDGSKVFLKPLNPRYPITDMTGIEFKIVGVVAERRKLY